MTLEERLPAGERIVADSSTILAYLDGTEAASPVASTVIDELVRSGRNPALLSAISVTEVLVRPMKASREATASAEDFLFYFPNLSIQPIDVATSREAARIRAVTGLKAPDALVLATASLAGIRFVVSNNDKWAGAVAKAAPGLVLCHLEAHLPL